MIINDTVDVRWHSKNKKHYESKGYKYTSWGDEFQVKVEDLSDGSGFKVDVMCDYCNNNITTMTYNEYNRRNRENLIKKDSCLECEIQKIKESNLLKYGTEYVAQLSHVKKKISKSHKTDYSEVKDYFEDKGYILLTDEYINNQQILNFICETHSNEGIQQTSYRNIKRSKDVCVHCHSETKKKPLLDSMGNEVILLNFYLRRNMSKSWKQKSMKKCDYKCIISNKRFDDIHHLYSFNSIVYEALNNINMDTYDSIEHYTDKQLFKITREVNKLHNLYPLGVCLAREIHTLFHSTYGYGNNTPEQFEEFKARLKLGEFNDFLEENNLKLAI